MSTVTQPLTRLPVNIDRLQAYAMEEVERNAWWDMYQAAPATYAANMKLAHIVKNETTLLSAAIPIGLFNRTFMHGLGTGLQEADIQYIMEYFTSRQVPNYHIYATPFSEPYPLDPILEKYGLHVVSATDKVFCELQKTSLSKINTNGINIRNVTDEGAGTWSKFICDTYGGLPNEPWLQALVDRDGWHHAYAEENGKIIACRSMFIDNRRRAWLGIDAPIPGVMTKRFELDSAICGHLLAIAKEQQVELVNSCIEAINDTHSGAAYDYYYRLGFKVAYRRKNFGLLKPL